MRGSQPFADLLRDPFWRWPVLVLICSFAGLLTYPIEKSWKLAALRFSEKRESARRISVLRALTKEERKALQAYTQRGTRTARWNIDSGVIAGLVSRDVLWRSQKYGSQIGGFAFNISDWAWNYLAEHPECIDTPGDDTMPDAFN